MLNKLLLKALLLPGVLLLVLFVMTFSVAPTLAYWANAVLGNQSTATGAIQNGQWVFTNDYVVSANALTTDLAAQTTTFQNYIYNQATSIPTNASTSTAYRLDPITINGIQWESIGYVTGPTLNNRSLGFVQMLDRSVVPDTTNAIFPVIPPAPSNPEPYPYYNFFFANDVSNTLTNNINGIRMNYQVDLITMQPMTGVQSITFYARRGLDDPSDLRTLRTTATFEVRYSTSRNITTADTGWTIIGSNNTPSGGTATSAAFTAYTFTIPTAARTQNIYIRIRFDGGTTGNKNNSRYSRLVIDDLIVNRT